MKQKCQCRYLQILTLGWIISSDVSRPASGLDVMLILESVVTPPFITRPFVIGLPVNVIGHYYVNHKNRVSFVNITYITYLRFAAADSVCASLFYT